MVVNSNFYKDTSGNILNEIWKEYAKADSRCVQSRCIFLSSFTVNSVYSHRTTFFLRYAILLHATSVPRLVCLYSQADRSRCLSH